MARIPTLDEINRVLAALKNEAFLNKDNYALRLKEGIRAEAALERDTGNSQILYDASIRALIQSGHIEEHHLAGATSKARYRIYKILRPDDFLPEDYEACVQGDKTVQKVLAENAELRRRLAALEQPES